MQSTGAAASVPAVDVFRTREHRRGLGAGMLARWAEGATFDTWGVFGITYDHGDRPDRQVPRPARRDRGALLMAALTPVARRLADRYGRRRVYGSAPRGPG